MPLAVSFKYDSTELENNPLDTCVTVANASSGGPRLFGPRVQTIDHSQQ